MKKSVLVLMAAAAMALTACASGSSEEAANTSSADHAAGNTGAAGTDAEKTVEASENDADSSDAEADNSATADGDFSTWDAQDITDYFKEKGVFVKDDWLYIQSEGVETPDGVTNWVSYMDDYGDADISIMYLAPNSASARTEEIYDEIKTTHQYIMTEAGNYPFPFNSLVGRFAITYSFSLDDQLVADFEQAYEELLEEYNLTPDFYEKELEIPDDEDDYENEWDE
jgi:Ni/Co efflux regulator RcnB